MENENLSFEQVVSDIEDAIDALSEDAEPEMVEFIDSDGKKVNLDLLFSFKINECMYAVFESGENEIEIFRRDNVHSESAYVEVVSEHEIRDIRNALFDLME